MLALDNPNLHCRSPPSQGQIPVTGELRNRSPVTYSFYAKYSCIFNAFFS